VFHLIPILVELDVHWLGDLLDVISCMILAIGQLFLNLLHELIDLVCSWIPSSSKLQGC
jgi:hypothetical protein